MRKGEASPRPLVRLGLLWLASSISARASDFAVGDLFVGTGGGYQRYSSSGFLLEGIGNGCGGLNTGCALDATLDLYTTCFEANRLVKLSHAHPHPVLLDFTTDGVVGGPDEYNESVVLDSSAHFFVGHAAIGAEVHRYDPTGVLVGEYTVASERQGSDWIDLAADQCTLFYTSEGSAIKRYDVCTVTQRTDFADVGGSRSFALRLLPPGDGSGGLVVASTEVINRLDGSGSVIFNYDAPGEDYWFAIALTPDGKSFWSADLETGNLYRFNLSTGAVEVGPIFGGGPQSVAGICLAGEPTAATCPGTPEIVRDLLAVRRTADVYLQWRAATDTATDHYGPWKVIDSDKLLIPVANGITAVTNPSIVAACPAVPRLTPSCTDAAAIGPPLLLFYQIRGACTNGVEGTDHPF